MKTLLCRFPALALVLVAAALSTGCVWTPELSAIKGEIARELPGAEFEKEITLSIGPGAMVLARAITGFIPDAERARPLLRDVSRVQVAVYKVAGADSVPALSTPERLNDLLDEGWEMAVRVRDTNERVWLLYRIDDDAVREMFVVVLDQNELVLVKIKGRLDRMLARAIHEARDDGWSLQRGRRPAPDDL